MEELKTDMKAALVLLRSLDSASQRQSSILERHTVLLEDVGAMKESLAGINTHTGTVADAIGKFMDPKEREDLIGLIAGKHQVPFLTHILTVAIIGVVALAVIVGWTRSEISWSKERIHIGRQTEAKDGLSLAPEANAQTR